MSESVDKEKSFDELEAELESEAVRLREYMETMQEAVDGLGEDPAIMMLGCTKVICAHLAIIANHQLSSYALSLRLHNCAVHDIHHDEEYD